MFSSLIKSPAGSASCTTCSPGHLCDTVSETECPAGSYSPGGAVQCTECISGTFSDSAAATLCTECPADFECTNKTKTACKTGAFFYYNILISLLYYSELKSESASISDNRIAKWRVTFFTSLFAGHVSVTSLFVGHVYVTSLFAGHVSVTSLFAGHVSVTLLFAGHVSVAGVSECQVCPSGTYSDTSCKVCIAGRKCELGVASLCPAGTHSSEGSATCVDCSAGSYSANPG